MKKIIGMIMAVLLCSLLAGCATIKATGDARDTSAFKQNGVRKCFDGFMERVLTIKKTLMLVKN